MTRAEQKERSKERKTKAQRETEAYQERLYNSLSSIYGAVLNDEDIPSDVMELDKCNNLPQLKTIYRKLMKKYHPDKAGDNSLNTKIASIITSKYKEKSLTLNQ